MGNAKIALAAVMAASMAVPMAGIGEPGRSRPYGTTLPKAASRNMTMPALPGGTDTGTKRKRRSKAKAKKARAKKGNK